MIAGRRLHQGRSVERRCERKRRDQPIERRDPHDPAVHEMDAAEGDPNSSADVTTMMKPLMAKKIGTPSPQG